MERTLRNHHDHLCSAWNPAGPCCSVPQSFCLNSQLELYWLQTFALLELSDISVDSGLKFFQNPVLL